MESMSGEIGAHPRLVFGEPGSNGLTSPIRLAPDDSNKENVREIDSEDDTRSTESEHKRRKSDYSSPEKIEMFNSLSPIKLDADIDEEKRDKERLDEAALAIQEAVREIPRESKDEEEEEEAFGKLSSTRNGSTGRTTPLKRRSESSPVPQEMNHEMMSPIMLKQNSGPNALQRETVFDWERNFNSLSENIDDKNNEIKVLNSELNELRSKLIDINHAHERQQLENIRLQKDYQTVKLKSDSSEEKLAELESLKVDFEGLNRRFEACKQKLKEVKIELSMTNQNNQILTEKFEKEYVKFTENENLLNDWKQKHNAISTELQNKNNELQLLEEQLRAQSKTVSEKSDEIKELKNAMLKAQSQFDAEKQDLDAIITDYKAKVEALNEDIEQSNNRGSDEVLSIQKKLQVAEAELASLTQKLTERDETMEVVTAKASQLKTEKETLEQDLQRTRRELELLKSKNMNIESEHLADLERLHENMSQMEVNLKQNITTITDLNSTIKEYDSQITSLKLERDALKSKLQEKSETEPAQPSSDVIEALQNKVSELEKTIAASDTETNKKLQLLAEDLYIQYSSKHEQKVKMLKKGYETKYHDLLDKLTIENNALHDEVNQLQKAVENERAEKQQLIKTLETS